MILSRLNGRMSMPGLARVWRTALYAAAAVGSLGVAKAADQNGIEFFEKRVRPLLADRCFECHGEKKQKGGLRLDSAAAIHQGGDSGPALVAGKPGESHIIKAVSWSDPDLQMP